MHGGAAWQLEARLLDADGLTIILAGRWCLDRSPPVARPGR